MLAHVCFFPVGRMFMFPYGNIGGIMVLKRNVFIQCDVAKREHGCVLKPVGVTRGVLSLREMSTTSCQHDSSPDASGML